MCIRDSPFGANENTINIKDAVSSKENTYDNVRSLTVNRTYYWRVRAIGENPTNFSQWSEVSRVIIKTNSK